MTTNVSQGSAQIFQLPVRARKPVVGHSEEPKPSDDVRSPRVSATAVGGAWYHEAAIQESKCARER